MNASPQSYYQAQTFTATIGGRTIQIISKPGIPDWDHVSPAQALLASVVEPPPAGARILLLGCGHGALGVALARQATTLELSDTSWIALAMAQRTIQANGVTNALVRSAISALPGQAGTFDSVAIAAPNDRKLTRRWLAEAHAALRDGGELLIAGANDHGIRSAIADAEALFGGAHVLAYKHGNRVAQARKAAGTATPEWASEAGIAPGTWYEFVAQARGHSFQVRSLPGVFAYDRVDAGTALLLDTLAIPTGARVLDVGCGYGIIGMLAARLGAAQVDLVDVNLLAVAAASENCARNDVPQARAFASDGVPEGPAQRYDVVVTNPPFHVGKPVDGDVARAFIERAGQALKPGGQLILVANQFLRYEQVLRSTFEHVVCLAANPSYRVWSAANRAVV